MTPHRRYPEFEKSPLPALAEAVIIDLVTSKIRRADYRSRPNPPILHRKETFLPPGHVLRGNSPSSPGRRRHFFPIDLGQIETSETQAAPNMKLWTGS